MGTDQIVGIQKREELEDETFAATFICRKCGPLNDWAGRFRTMEEAEEFYDSVASYDVTNAMCWKCSAEGQEDLELMTLFVPSLVH